MERLIAEAAFYGGAKDQTTGSAVTLNFTLYRVHTVSTTSAGLNIKLQSARQLKTGGVTGVVVNAGANSFNLIDNSNNLLLAMAAGDSAVLGLIDNTTAAGSWIVRSGTANFVADPPVNLYFYVVGGRPTGTYDHMSRQYEPQTDAWTLLSDMPSPVTLLANGASAVYGTSGYFVGITGGTSTDRKKIYQYDPDVWTEKTANAATLMSEGTMCKLSTSLMSFNGEGGFSNRNTDEYAVAGDSWTVRTSRSATYAVTEPTSCAMNGKAVLTDGDNNAVESYVVDTFTVRTFRPGADARRGSAVSRDTTATVYGGVATVSGYIANVYVYTEATDSWSSLASLSPAREQASSCAIGSSNYLVGGTKGTTGTPASEVTNDTNDTIEHVIGSDTYVTRTGAPGDGSVYDAMNQGAAITP